MGETGGRNGKKDELLLFELHSICLLYILKVHNNLSKQITLTIKQNTLLGEKYLYKLIEDFI